MDSAPGGHFALYFTIKSLNCAESRRRKHNRSKVLGFGASGPASDLYNHFNITSKSIIDSAKLLLK